MTPDVSPGATVPVAPPPAARLPQRLVSWAGRARLTGKLAVGLTIAAVAAGLATYIALTSPTTVAQRPGAVLLLLNLDLVLLLLLGAVVARRIVQIWVERRRGSAGSRLHVRLVMIFSALAATPAVIVAVFSVLLFDLGLQAWFSERVRVALSESSAVAEAYLEEHRNAIRGDILAMAYDLQREGPLLRISPRRMQQVLNDQLAARSLTEAVVFEPDGRVIAHSGLILSLVGELVPDWALARANAGDVALISPAAEADEAVAPNAKVRALIRLELLDGLYLLVGRFVDPQVVGHVERTRDAVSSYQNLEGRRSNIQITFALIFVVVAVLLLLAAIWVGLYFANRLARPIGALVTAAERVRAGDLGARVAEDRSDDELASLNRAFNRMTSQLDTQRRELVEANRQLDERRRFTEAVLAGVSAGVIGLDGGGRINLPNRSASTLLSTDLDRQIGTDFRDVMPEMAHLLDAARGNPSRLAQEEVTLHRDGRRRTLLVRVAAERIEGDTEGYVVTFDDITELENAQRKAAWADVARRIAHEIKNPLTPIQLSAERLKRKYLDEIRSDPETFRICTETIVRQVGDIGRMVDEFSSFARMPAPVMRDEDLVDLVRQTVFLQRNARPEIRFELALPAAPVWRPIDARLVGQGLTNLLQNALDAIAGREPGADGAPPPQGLVQVELAVEGEGATITVADNGRGLPAGDRDRLTEPYVTTRAKGTGLGLAIVKKIMEDHGGELVLADNPGGGARVSMRFHAPTAIPQPRQAAHGS